MSVPRQVASQAQQRVERQAADVVERAVNGARTGTYSVSHLGTRWGSALVTFALADPVAERAYLRFVRASLNFECRRDQASQLALAQRVLHLDELVSQASRLEASEVSAIRRELDQYLQAVRQVDEESVAAAQKIRAAAAKRKTVPRLLAGDKIQREIHMAAGRVRFFNIVAALSHAGALPSEADARFLQAYRTICHAMGVDLGSGWKQVFEYLADNAGAAKRYREKVKDLPVPLRSGIHNKVKGLMGERYFTQWADWRLIKSSYLDVARRLAKELGREWEVVPVAGRMFLGGKETWDEAILLVNRSKSPAEAKLYMAAQVKVAIEARALDQTVYDLLREAANRDLRIVPASGDPAWFVLTPLPAGQKAIRWVTNAAGGEIPTRDLAALLKAGVQVHQKTMPASIEDFNLVADRMIQAFVEAAL